MYAHVTNGTIDTVGRLPNAVRNADGNWVMLSYATPDELAALGWHAVTDTPRPDDTDTTTHDRSIELVAGTPTVTWTPRPYTADEQTGRTADANRTTIETQAETALIDNATYLGLTTPTQGEAAAQIKALTRQTNKIIRLLLNRLEATE